jgi:hypothetical protein
MGWMGWLANDDHFLVADYEAARMPCATDLRRKLDWYYSKEMKDRNEIEEEMGELCL